MGILRMGSGACERSRRYLGSYIENGPKAINQEALRHLETCPSCAAELEALRRLRSRLKAAVKRQPLPRDLHVRLREMIRRRESDETTGHCIHGFVGALRR